MALGVQSIWSCIRNTVDSVVVDGSPGFDGIAEEHVRGTFKGYPQHDPGGLHGSKFLETPATESYLLTQ
jgi:hypothetical protein